MSSGRARPATRRTTRRRRAARRALRLAPRDLPRRASSAGSSSRAHQFRRGPRARPCAPWRLAPSSAARLRRPRRRARRARPLRRGVPRVQHDGSLEARASPRTRASRTRASCAATVPAQSRRCASPARRRRRLGRSRPHGFTSQLGKLFWTSRPVRGRGGVPRGAGGVPGLRLRPRRLAQVAAARAVSRARPRWSGAWRRFRCRSSSASSPTSTRGRRPRPRRRSVRADRRDRPPASRERRAAPIWRLALFDVDHGSRLDARRSRARGARRSRAVDRRRRRPRLGARAERPLRGGARAIAARTSARHARRAEVLPPRHDRALSRPRSEAKRLVPPGARRSTRTSRSLGADREEVRVDEEARPPPRAARSARAPAGGAPRIRSATSPSTASAGSRSPATASTCATCSTSPRSRRSRRGKVDAPTLRAPHRARRPADGRRAPRVSLVRWSTRSRTRGARAGCRRRGSRSSCAARGCSAGATSATATQLRRPARLEGNRRRRRRPESEPRAARLPPRPALDPLDVPCPREPGPGASDTLRTWHAVDRAGPGPRRRLRFRRAREPRRARLLGRARLARRRALLGAGPRASPGHGKTIVTAYLVASAGRPACGAARPDRHGHAHDGRVRPRPCHAAALALHRPRRPLSLAQPRRRAARRRDRRLRAAARWRHRRAHVHGHAITTITTSTDTS